MANLKVRRPPTDRAAAIQTIPYHADQMTIEPDVI